ncbi:hypothetical protein HCBG_07141 [Histoplasma capsulatum G186AR]|uniref:Uncharacterized protein n=2 Tax=Ajellomyces capsulatus TaxID=5037 RepID=C0NVG1_AJECG|nr:uncharacterized protein HCBG_07141 [Histoplasma capsulatum G186AR]EEH04500.1 hypothetical protein HCBG_07141 [Histoplasma capsulatum G186AR]KAG5296330.1 hypothetical protein I7I52_06948 [Histoplasma capsulatum]QSS74312.1 hypothetical protein I7I50_09427 [Histoplasma capsulatum G186AR]
MNHQHNIFSDILIPKKEKKNILSNTIPIMSGIRDTWNTGRRTEQQESQNNPLRSSGDTEGGMQGMHGSQGIGQSELGSSNTYGTQSTQGYGAGEEQQYGQHKMGRSSQPMSSGMGQGQEGIHNLGAQGMGSEHLGNQGIGSEGMRSENWQDQPGESPGRKRGSQSSEASDISSASQESHDDKSGASGLLEKAKDKLSGVR